MFGKARGPLGLGKVDTVIGEGAQLKGVIESTGVLRIDGHFEGQIDHAGELIVGPRGRIVATVKAKSMAIAGEVRGDVTTEAKLEIMSSGCLIGNSHAGQLVVHEGGKFHGRSLMSGPIDVAVSPAEETP
jgi:cytoskeletal protein CcmA (bactofilin family)